MRGVRGGSLRPFMMTEGDKVNWEELIVMSSLGE